MRSIVQFAAAIDALSPRGGKSATHCDDFIAAMQLNSYRFGCPEPLFFFIPLRFCQGAAVTSGSSCFSGRGFRPPARPLGGGEDLLHCGARRCWKCLRDNRIKTRGDLTKPARRRMQLIIPILLISLRIVSKHSAAVDVMNLWIACSEAGDSLVVQIN